MFAILRSVRAWLILLGVVTLSGSAGALDWDLRGYADARWFGYLGAERDPWEVGLRARPRLRLDLPADVFLVFEPEARYSFGRNEEQFEDVDDVLNVERLFVDAALGPINVTAGRQAVNWGNGIIFNPTDLFDDVFLRDVWAEPSGYDALKLTVPFGPTRELIALASTDEGTLDDTVTALRGRLTMGTTDLALVAARDPVRDQELFGADVKGEAVVGMWLEAAWTQPRDGSSFVRSVAGVDYTFALRDALYVALQYYRDGSGETDQQRYDLGALLRGERSTLARNYATLTGRLFWSEDLALGTQTIANLDDGSLVLTAFGDYTRIPGLTLSVGGTWLAGQPGGEFNPPPRLDPEGRLPQAITYVWLRYHF